MPVSTDERVALLRRWKESNPLVRYCREHGFKLMDAAALIGISYSALLEWTKGTAQPRDFRRIAEFMGPVNEQDLRSRWDKWLKQRPRS